MCSRTWEIPVQRSGSSKKPALTWVTTATTGAEWSGWTSRVRPLGRTSRPHAGQSSRDCANRGTGQAVTRSLARFCSTPASALPRMNASASVVGMIDAGLRLAAAGQAGHEVARAMPWAHSRSAAFSWSRISSQLPRMRLAGQGHDQVRLALPGLLLHRVQLAQQGAEQLQLMRDRGCRRRPADASTSASSMSIGSGSPATSASRASQGVSSGSSSGRR